jgi:hypothetical protein
LKGTYNFQNCLRIQFVKVFAQQSALENVLSLFTSLLFLP